MKEEFDACREMVKSRLIVVKGTIRRFCRTTDKNFYRGKNRRFAGSSRLEFRLFVLERQDPNGKVIPFG